MDYQTDFRPELIAEDAFLAEGVKLIGNVVVESLASIWFNAVVRGDCERILIGRESNVQDLSVLHADPGFPCLIGERVTIGHAALVHGAVIEDDVLIGMRSVVMNGARIGSGSIIGAATVVTEGKQIPPNSVVLGIPGRVVRQAEERDRAAIAHAASHYVEASQAYRSAGA